MGWVIGGCIDVVCEVERCVVVVVIVECVCVGWLEYVLWVYWLGYYDVWVGGYCEGVVYYGIVGVWWLVVYGSDICVGFDWWWSRDLSKY